MGFQVVADHPDAERQPPGARELVRIADAADRRGCELAAPASELRVDLDDLANSAGTHHNMPARDRPCLADRLQTVTRPAAEATSGHRSVQIPAADDVG